MAKELVSVRTNGYQMKEGISSIHWYLVLHNPAKGSQTAAGQSRAVFLMVRIIITQILVKLYLFVFRNNETK